MAFDEKEWTIMIYFASDNALAPEVVSQIKSIKQAGFHPEANVVAQFDPHTEGTPTHIFDVNRINKLQAEADVKNGVRDRNGEPVKDFKIGFVGRSHDDPYVVNVMADKIWDEETDAEGVSIRERIRKFLADMGIDFKQPELPEQVITSKERTRQFLADMGIDFREPDPPESVIASAARARNPHRPEEPSPKDSLRSFLQFCSDNYPARHYILFILGHGVVVGNDIFLLDEHAARTSMTLTELGVELGRFKENIKKTNAEAEFEMIGFHSCSLSSLEVACEIEGTANFMLASQGPAFTGTWPYRQMLIRVFKDLRRGSRHFNDPEFGRANVKRMLTKLFAYCLFNSLDFVVAGYTYDVALTDLNRLRGVREAISRLSTELIGALRDPLACERVLLAHWDAQSFWKENYTDVNDFCFRLRRRCLTDETDEKSPLLNESLRGIFDRCRDVITTLTKELESNVEQFIIRSEFAGASVQYSNGISVYFPWSESLRDNFLAEYGEYKFIKNSEAFGENSWLDFLNAYFSTTRRRTRSQERPEQRPLGQPPIQSILAEAFVTTLFNADGQLSKPGPGGPNGDDDGDVTIKNYPPFTRVPRRADGIVPDDVQGVSQTFFASAPDDDEDAQEEQPFLSEFA